MKLRDVKEDKDSPKFFFFSATHISETAVESYMKIQSEFYLYSHARVVSTRTRSLCFRPKISI